jgi:ribosomal protein S27AE
MDQDRIGKALSELSDAVAALALTQAQGFAALTRTVEDIRQTQIQLAGQIAAMSLQLGQMEAQHLDGRPVESCGSCGSPLAQHQAAAGLMLACEVCGWTGFLEKVEDKEE